jgi:hypothetical protein
VTPAAPPKIITRQRAWVCVAMNQLAFPGLGTIMARRWTGYIQATIMVLGFCLFIGFMLVYFADFSRFAMGEFSDEQFRAHYRSWLWTLWSGLGLTALAWVSALFSSVSVLREAARNSGSQRR